MAAKPDAKNYWWLYVTAILYGLSFVNSPIHDPDLGWHLFGGAWTVHNKAVPSDDLINTFNQRWHDYHWLGEVIFYKLFALGGYPLLQLMLGLLMAWIGVVLVDITLLSQRKTSSSFVAILTFSFAFWMVGEVVSIRPHVIALLVIAMSVRRLIQAPTRFELPILFFLTAFLVNVHIYWIMIPFLWGLYRCLPRLRSDSFSARYAWGGLAVLCVAGFVSPYGFLGSAGNYILMNYGLVWDYLTMPEEIRERISEMKGGLATVGFLPVALLIGLAFGSRVFSWKRALVRPSNVVGWFATFILTVRSLKFAPIFAIVGAPYQAYSFREINRLMLGRGKRFDSALSIVLALGIASWSLYTSFSGLPWVYSRDAELAEYHPIAACEKLASLKLTPSNGRSHVRVLTHFNYGGWCRWTIYQADPSLDYRVTTDGRTQWVPPDRMLKSFNLYMLKDGWSETLNSWRPDAALVWKSSQLAQVMARLPAQWKIVHEDNNFAVFLPIK